MKRKYILMFMYLLTSVCIFSIGFSSWTIVQNATIDTTGNIQASDLIDQSKCIYFDEKVYDKGIKNFEYCKAGFVNSNLQTVSYTGETGAYLKINLDNCIEYFKGSSSIAIEIELRYNNHCEYNIFDESVLISNTVTLGNGVYINAIPTQENSYKLNFVLENYLNSATEEGIIDNLAVNILFELTEDQFLNLYNYLDEMSFEYVLKIEGVPNDKN